MSTWLRATRKSSSVMLVLLTTYRSFPARRATAVIQASCARIVPIQTPWKNSQMRQASRSSSTSRKEYRRVPVPGRERPAGDEGGPDPPALTARRSLPSRAPGTTVASPSSAGLGQGGDDHADLHGAGVL